MGSTPSKGLMNRSLRERYIVQKHIRGVRSDQTVNMNDFRLRVPPHPTKKLVIFLGRPSRVLWRMAIVKPTMADNMRTYHHYQNVRAGQVEPGHPDVGQNENSRIVTSSFPKSRNDCVPGGGRHIAMKLQ